MTNQNTVAEQFWHVPCLMVVDMKPTLNRDRLKYWGKVGALGGGFWGLLFGAAFFWVPGIGPTLIAGPLVASFVAALESAIVVGGLSALGAALYELNEHVLKAAHATDGELADKAAQ
jgi:hypothetical protein